MQPCPNEVLMKKILVIGSGISGMSSAISCAQRGMEVTLVSPFVSERSQSVMAAGGINAAFDHMNENDSVEKHIEDTLKGGSFLAGPDAVKDLCSHAPDVIRWLEKLGTVFTLKEDGRFQQRAFGGQSCRRTCYCGSATGKLIVSSLVMECRRYEAKGLIHRKLRNSFHSGLIRDGVCYGALLYDEAAGQIDPVFADAVIMATGGQNSLFGKTTGSTQCDGYAAGKLFMQGAALKNLEFIQYHPTTLETAQKKMLITEAVRGEGGRLYYIENGKRVYFMEDRFGPKGNLMTRDVVTRCIYETGKDIFLDISFLDKKIIDARLPEVRDLCLKYRNLDITKESIPVTPSVHFFMGGLAAGEGHETSIRNLYAVGECASRYHGANRLGGNSLLAAVYSGIATAENLAGKEAPKGAPDFTAELESARAALAHHFSSESRFPVMYLRDCAAEIMNTSLGIVRDEASLEKGIEDLDFYISTAKQIRYDKSVLPYLNYSLEAILTLAKATLICAKERRESRGSHYRRDYPKEEEAFRAASVIRYQDGAFPVQYDHEGKFEH